MDRILIVEDNKTLAKLIAKKILTELNFEVDVAYTLLEAKLFLKRYTYFLTLLDLNLPDAPNGEVVEYVLGKKNHVIVLSANIDKNFRAQMLKKNIIDYVNKSGVTEINYIIQSIQRLHKNKKHKVLVVDDSMVLRKQLKGMLENLFFRVITVAHGEEALGMLNTHPDISLVLTDYNMPVMDGLELTREIRKTYNKNDLSIIALSSNDNDEINAMFLKNGANDYIKKPFSKEEFSCRINNTIEALENIHIITNHSKRDFLTGLYSSRYFLKLLQEYADYAKETSQDFVIAIVGIDNFKQLTQKHGQKNTQKMILTLADVLRSNIHYQDIVAKAEDDQFYLALKNTSKQEALVALEKLKQKAEDALTVGDDGETITFSISIGVSIDQDEGLDESINHADMMLFKAKQQGTNQLIFH